MNRKEHGALGQNETMAISVQYLYLKLKPHFPELQLSTSAGAFPQEEGELPIERRPILERLCELPDERGCNENKTASGPGALLAAENAAPGNEAGEVIIDGTAFQVENCPPLLFFSEARPNVALPMPVLLYPDKSARFSLYREIWEILGENDRWQLDISRELIKVSSAASLLSLTSRLIDSPMYFADANFMMIAAHGEVNPEAHWVVLYHQKHGYLPFEILMKLIHTGELARINESSDAVYISQSRCFRLPYITKVLHQGSRVLGYLVIVEYRHKLSDYELEIADCLGNILSDAPAGLVPWLQTEQFLHERFLLDIMTGGLQDREDIQRQLREFSWNLDDDYRLLVLNTRKKDVLINHNLISVFSEGWDARGFTYKDLIVLVYHQPAAYLEALREKFPPLFQLYEIRGAMSEEFCDFTEIKTFFRQSVQTMLLSEKYGNTEGIQFFEDYYLLYRSGLVSENMPAYCPVEKMRRYDLENETNYCQTLYEYLRQGNNLVTAAKSLYLHRNTMNYRMNKIRELFGLDLDSPQVRGRCLDSLEQMMPKQSREGNP